MFNTNSDYVINKLDTDAIVCRSVTGQLLRITREDFSSDEEFENVEIMVRHGLPRNRTSRSGIQRPKNGELNSTLY